MTRRPRTTEPVEVKEALEEVLPSAQEEAVEELSSVEEVAETVESLLEGAAKMAEVLAPFGADRAAKVSERTRIYPANHVEKNSRRRLKFTK